MREMLDGACLCGRIRYEITAAPRFMYRCYCGKCRAASGAPFVENLIIASADFRVAAGKESLVRYESSPGKFRHFCAACGSPIYSQGDKTQHFVSVRAGTLKQDPGVRAAYHAFVASRAPWVEIDDDLPQFPEWPDPELAKRLYAVAEPE